MIIKMDVRGIRWDAMDWIYLAQDKDQRHALLYKVYLYFGFRKVLKNS
jgi:hypothetical protein